MLLREDGDAVVCIGQPAHAWVSGQLARAWGNARFGPVEPAEEVCLAAEQHDIGMAAWDAAPDLNPATGRPYSFVEMPLATHLELWSRAPRLALSQGRYAALLVSMHGVALYEMRDLDRLDPPEAAAVRGYMEAQRAFQEEIRASLGAPEDEVRRNQRLIWTWDFLSLALCLDWAPATAKEVPAAGAPVDVRVESRTLDPWPFAAERVELHCDGRRLEGRFEDQERMRAALEAAPWVTLRWALEAGSPAGSPPTISAS
jgi:hypothetical protein